MNEKEKEQTLTSTDRSNKANDRRQQGESEVATESKSERQTREGIERSKRLQALISQKRPDLYEAKKAEGQPTK